jgi:gentisate 1,2-dioxygenase
MTLILSISIKDDIQTLNELNPVSSLEVGFNNPWTGDKPSETQRASMNEFRQVRKSVYDITITLRCGIVTIISFFV